MFPLQFSLHFSTTIHQIYQPSIKHTNNPSNSPTTRQTYQPATRQTPPVKRSPLSSTFVKPVDINLSHHLPRLVKLNPPKLSVCQNGKHRFVVSDFIFEHIPILTTRNLRCRTIPCRGRAVNARHSNFGRFVLSLNSISILVHNNALT